LGPVVIIQLVSYTIIGMRDLYGLGEGMWKLGLRPGAEKEYINGIFVAVYSQK
jgi:hypothetical protein